ncbi:hypothetical protein [Pseudomonas helleri]|uniref:Uncharacterized protein n=1 Tax=Pseudomonas helleri TaxID=1608996 RepID=A0A7X2BSE6_9PSED|nr:hypothetical protein [Pseudomonas helleri]MQT73312.1 hypothetical protein [Pseudomonas helleri]
MAKESDHVDFLPERYATVTKHLEGLVDAAFTMAEAGDDPRDVLAMIRFGLEKVNGKGNPTKR